MLHVIVYCGMKFRSNGFNNFGIFRSEQLSAEFADALVGWHTKRIADWLNVSIYIESCRTEPMNMGSRSLRGR